MREFQQDTISSSSRRLFFGWIAAIALVVCTTYLLDILAFQGVGAGVLLILPFLVGFWALFARGQWWATLPVACSFGGMLYFGFRIHTHELALLLAIVSLLPYVAMTSLKKTTRSPLPIATYLLCGYFVAHLCVSEYLCVQEGMGGMGNIMRVYVHGLWPVVFAILFIRYGSIRHLRYILLIMYFASFARVALGFLSFLAPRSMIFIPFINYILPGTSSAGMDLRASTLLLTSMALCYSSLAKSSLARWMHLAVLIPAGYLLLLGAGRVSLAVFCGMILFWALLHRKFVLLGVMAASLALVIGILNSDPSIMQNADQRVQRTLSILVIKSQNTDVHKPVEDSDRWHYDLMRHGQDRWLTSPMTFLFGNRIHRYDDSFYSPWVSMGMREELAARMGAYESGLWTVLAVTGIVGAVLYVLIFRGLLTDVTLALFSTGIRNHADAFSFLAVSGALLWVVLCWISGHFPSQELMMAVIAKAAYDDARAAANAVTEPVPPATQTPPISADGAVLSARS